jgi:hypothetical protein
MEIELDIAYISFYYLYLSIISLFTLITYLWFGVSSISYYKTIVNQRIEPWIKKRYFILGLSSLIASMNGIIYLLFPFNSTSFEELFTFVVGLLLEINFLIFSIGNLLAWLMPKQLKDYFNKDFQPLQEETLSEKELMEEIKLQLSKGD